MARTDLFNQGGESFEDSRQALKRFPKDCVDLAFDYVHKRHADLNFRMMNRLYDSKGCMRADKRAKYFLHIIEQGKRMEYECKPHSMFSCFVKTLCWDKSCDSYKQLAENFRDDLLKHVFHYNYDCITWDNIILAIVMTSAFVRHLTNGNRSPDCVLALFNGLYCVMEKMSCAVKRLRSWECLGEYYRCKDNKEDPDRLFQRYLPSIRGNRKRRRETDCDPLKGMLGEPTPKALCNPYSTFRQNSASLQGPPSPPTNNSGSRKRNSMRTGSPSYYSPDCDDPCAQPTRSYSPDSDDPCAPPTRSYSPDSDDPYTPNSSYLPDCDDPCAPNSSYLPDCNDPCRPSFAEEGKETVIELMNNVTKCCLSRQIPLSDRQICDIKRRLVIIREAELSDWVMERVRKAVNILACSYQKYAECKSSLNDLQQDATDTLWALVKSLCMCGWDAILALFIVVRCLCKKCCEEPNILVMKTMADASYTVFNCSQRNRDLACLGTWDKFDEHYTRQFC